MDTNQIVAELTKERDRLDSAIKALTSSGDQLNNRKARTATRDKRGGRRAMSAAARKRLSQLLKQRWASGKMGRRKKATRSVFR